MALVDFLYRCPFCGHDPLQGAGDTARCGSCGRSFRTAPAEGGIAISEGGGETRVVPVDELSRRIEALGGVLTRAQRDDGSLRYEAVAAMRLAVVEEPVHYGGSLFGFTEQLGSRRDGTLVLDDRTLQFLSREGDREVVRWDLKDVRALQGASSSVQLSPRTGGVAVFRFLDDSPRRWEALLAHALRRVWLEEGWGEIVEFQPRIRAK